ncbi:transposase [bacterium]|nr:transposase [bacterium]
MPSDSPDSSKYSTPQLPKPKPRYAASMTQARKHIVNPLHAGTFHCVARCVRRSWLCGIDAYSGQSFEHRKAWIEQRIRVLADSFACSVLSYAVMSNHFHLVVAMTPEAANNWSAQELAERWCRLYARKASSLEKQAEMDAAMAQKAAAIAADPTRVRTYRLRLCNLSWLMKLLNEPIAKRANAEDNVKGRFWESRFKCQLLQSENSILAAMTYVDLNPVRAKVADSLSTSHHTSVKIRSKAIRGDLRAAAKPLKPLLGCQSYSLPKISEAEYIALVDYTGRQFFPGKRGRIKESQPKALDKLGLNPNHWSHRVKGFGEGFGAKWFRVVGELEEMLEKAKQIKQRTFFGVGLARVLAKT